MKEVHETLLYIIHSLQTQNQVTTVEAIKKTLDLIQNVESCLDDGINWLIDNGFIVKNSENELSFTEMGQREASQISKTKSKAEFDHLITAAINSKTYLDYCEEICGYRIPLFNMMDKQQLDYLFNAVPVSKNDTVLDLGCGTGSILNYLVQKYKCCGIGIDRLNAALVQKCSNAISYIEGDMDNLSSCNLESSIILSVDSFYFSNDLDSLVKFLKPVKDNRLYVFYSQYIFDESKKERSVLHCDSTRMACTLQQNNIQYRVIDYSTNEYLLYKNAIKVLNKYKGAFEGEDNCDLYEYKLKENKTGQELYEKGLASRYLYIVE